MPCALSQTIMSTEYAQEGHDRECSRSTTVMSEDLSDDHTKIDSNVSTPEVSPRSSPIHRATNGTDPPMATNTSSTTTATTRHSFSIDALVGNTDRINEGQNETYPISASNQLPPPAPPSSNSSWNSNQLIELKRIQSYYQHLYNNHHTNSPLKQLNNFLYPEPNNSDTFKHDQLLAYYANFYLHSSSFYQERYLQSLKQIPISENEPTMMNGHVESIYRSDENRDKSVVDMIEEKISKLDGRDSSHRNDNESNYNDNNKMSVHYSRDCYYGLSNATSDSRSSTPNGKQQNQQEELKNDKGSLSSPIALLPPPPPPPTSSTSSLYSLLDGTKLSNESLAGMRSKFPSHLLASSSSSSSSSSITTTTSAINGNNFYPQYCDYDLMVKSKSNLLLAAAAAAASSSSTNCHSTSSSSLHLHSPLIDPNVRSSSPISNGTGTSKGNPNQSASAAAAAAAFHLSNMFRKPKRIRTAFSPGQLLRLEEIFEKNRYVVGCERKQLARDLNLSETQIKVWFQNRRTKHKREKHVRRSPSLSDHSANGNGNHNYGIDESNNKKPFNLRPLTSLSSSSSSSSSGSANSFISNTNYGSSAAAAYNGGHHFQGQSGIHRTLLAK